uniref:Putative secreted protein n=1 Tax=Anopheles darlingi TaxID=43151 RepID=A0A2M4DSA4_ANODA
MFIRCRSLSSRAQGWFTHRATLLIWCLLFWANNNCPAACIIMCSHNREGPFALAGANDVFSGDAVV